MTNAELISMVRSIAKHGADWRINEVLNRAADALEAAEKRINELESQAAFFDAEKQNYQENIEYRDERINELEAQLTKRGAIMLDEMPKRILGYDAEKLILFAMMCEKNDVRETDLKQAAWNLELAVRAVMNERAEIVKNTMDEFTMRFTPDFEKAFEEMMPNCGARMRTVTDCHTLEEGEHDEN